MQQKTFLPSRTIVTSRREFLSIMAWTLFSSEEEKTPQIELRIIRVNTRPEAEDILRRLKSGEPFEALAKQFSIDASALAGGDIGKVRLSALRLELQTALQGIAPGQFTGFVATPSGYVILKVVPESETGKYENLAHPRQTIQPAPLNYQLVTSVIGDSEVEGFFRRFPKPPGYEQDLKLVCESRHRAIEAGILQLQSELAAMPPAQATVQETNDTKMRAHYALAQVFSYQGEMEKAIEHFQAAYDLAAASGVKEYQLSLEKVLGIAELRRGELDNCLHHHNASMCVLPLRREAQHRLTSGSENAVRHFLKYLDQNPDDWEEKWLLNLAFMTLGKYPARVPKNYLIAPQTFESAEKIAPFQDVAPFLGLDIFNTAGGVIMEDLDNDGYLDIVISGMEPCQQLRYFHNNGDGTFTDRTTQAGLTGQLGGLNIIQGDYNNDGWMDILVLRGGWLTPVRKSLLRNNGDGSFTDVTRQAGLAEPGSATQTAVWADFDNDGWLDLFVGNENAAPQLFHNNGDGTFTDIARAAGVDQIAYTKSVVAGDYNNDRYPDIYMSNYRQENFLYHNNRDGTFTEVARELGVEKPIFSFPAWFFDYDNDGWLDLFVSSYIVSVAEVLRSYLGLAVQAETLKLYKNTGGTFRDVTKEVGLDRVFMPMGANFGDIDNDGFLDFYLGTGSPSYASLVPNVLFRNRAGKRFVDITAASGTGSLQKGHGVAIGNLFNDGSPVIFSELGGMAPGDAYYSALFRNPHPGNNWIDLKLVGVKTNRAAIGARIRLTLRDEEGKSRSVYKHVSSGGSFGASPLQQHIGLGKATRIETLTIDWPTSGTRQVFSAVGVNQFLEVKEFDKTYSQLNRQAVKLPAYLRST
jgi:tetratricopeptide (TPR) repeat protein